MDDYELNTSVLEKLIRTLSGKSPVARVGILGKTDSRAQTQVQGSNGRFSNQGPTSNATVGAAHEFGTSKLPRRSFLKVPIQDNLDKEIEKSKAFDENVLAEVLKSGNVNLWLEKLGVLGEAIAIDAFNTNGFGKWAPWSPGYSNNTGNVLVDTQQLKRSITHDVVGGK